MFLSQFVPQIFLSAWRLAFNWHGNTRAGAGPGRPRRTYRGGGTATRQTCTDYLVKQDSDRNVHIYIYYAYTYKKNELK